MTDVKVEKVRIHHADGSATDVIKTIRTRRTWFGDHVNVDVRKEHHTKQELESEAKWNLVIGGAIVVGSLVAGAIAAVFGDKDD